MGSVAHRRTSCGFVGIPIVLDPRGLRRFLWVRRSRRCQTRPAIYLLMTNRTLCYYPSVDDRYDVMATDKSDVLHGSLALMAAS